MTRVPLRRGCVLLALASADGLVRAPLPALRLGRLGRPTMFQDGQDRDGGDLGKKPIGSKLPNPFEVIITVVAQADIVGVQMPWRAPNAMPSPVRGFEPKEHEPEILRLPNHARREVDRTNVHPLLKLGDGDAAEPLLSSLLSLPTPLLLSLLAPLLLAVSPLLVWLVAARKAAWADEVAVSKAEHQSSFDETWRAYREEQAELVERLLQARAAGVRDPLLPTRDAPYTIAVTMATGQ